MQVNLNKNTVDTLLKHQQELEQSYTCPLTLDFMVFPIKGSDNYIYERSIITITIPIIITTRSPIGVKPHSIGFFGRSSFM